LSIHAAKHVETIEKARANMRVPPLLLNFVAFAFAVAIWWAITAAKLVVLPGPLEVFQRALQLIANGQLPLDIVSSLRRVLTGFLLGVALAVPVGFLMGWYRVARALIEPYIQFFRMVPPLAVIPLAIVTMGIDETPKILSSSLHLSCLPLSPPIRASSVSTAR